MTFFFTKKRLRTFAMSENKQVSFDFSAPLSRHPNDASVDTEDLIEAGILSINDFKSGNTSISSKQYLDFRRKFVAHGRFWKQPALTGPQI
jgi:hypothetical protein